MRDSLVIFAMAKIRRSEIAIKRGERPTACDISAMEEIASDLIEAGKTTIAARVDGALVKWCGLLLDA